MECVNCDFCKTDNAKLLFLQKDKFGITNDDFKIIKCQNCGLIYVNPHPTQKEIVEFYPDTYSWKETLVAESFFTRIIRKLEKFYRGHLLKYEVNKVIKFTKKKKGKILDIGCGAGDRLNLFRKKGFDTYGTEITDMADYAKDFFGLNVIKKDLFDANLPDVFFDIITLHNVIEHVPNPQDIIKECYRILKKNGFLVMQTPNINCFQFKFLKNRWTVIDPPRHLYYFSDLILKKELEKNKFKVTKIDYFFNWWHPPTIVISLFPNLDPQMSWLEEKNKGNPVLKRLFWIFWTLTLPVFTFFESLFKKGAIITFYAEKY